MKKTLLIVNPCSGKKRIKNDLLDVISKLCASDRNVTVAVTAHRGHATEIAERAEGYDEIICSGGDGTVNEVFTGLIRANKNDIPVGYLPAGSTNDFANSIKLAKNVLQATDDIVNGQPILYDVGKFENKYFSYIASFGAFTQASYSTPQNLKNALGHFAYVLEGTKYLPQIAKPLHIKITTDKGKVFDDNYIFGSITNSTYIGGLIKFDPTYVDMSDGMLELFLIKPPADIIQLNQCLAALNNQKYQTAEMISFCSAKEFTIESDGSFPWTLDGEKEEGKKVIHISNVHNAIRIIKVNK